MLVIWKRFCNLTYSMYMYDVLLSVLSLPACVSVNPKYIGVIHTKLNTRVLLFFFVAAFFFLGRRNLPVPPPKKAGPRAWRNDFFVLAEQKVIPHTWRKHLFCSGGVFCTLQNTNLLPIVVQKIKVVFFAQQAQIVWHLQKTKIYVRTSSTYLIFNIRH